MAPKGAPKELKSYTHGTKVESQACQMPVLGNKNDRVRSRNPAQKQLKKQKPHSKTPNSLRYYVRKTFGEQSIDFSNTLECHQLAGTSQVQGVLWLGSTKIVMSCFQNSIELSPVRRPSCERDGPNVHIMSSGRNEPIE